MLCEAGADIDLGDKQGSLQMTPLLVATHSLSMAVHQTLQLGSATSLRVEVFQFSMSTVSTSDSLRGKACFGKLVQLVEKQSSQHVFAGCPIRQGSDKFAAVLADQAALVQHTA